MRKIKALIIFSLFVCFILSTNSIAKEIDKKFSGKNEIKIGLVLGECEIVNSEDEFIHVHVYYTYDDESFKVLIKEKNKRLTLKERFNDDDSDGESKWTIKIPYGIEVDFESATGGLSVTGLSEVELGANSGIGNITIDKSNGKFDINCGTGNIDVTGSKGEFELNSGTGDVSIHNTQGEFDVNGGTGDVYGENITINEEADFNSGTGEALVKAPLGEDFDLSINSGTDDAILDLNGQPLKGYFEFTAHSRRGDIDCPVAFDKETTYENGNGTYDRKSFTKGKDSPRYFISTGTGKAELKR